MIEKLLKDFWVDYGVTSKRLNRMSVNMLYKAIDAERSGLKRDSALKRLHQALCQKRMTEERKAILSRAEEWRR